MNIKSRLERLERRHGNTTWMHELLAKIDGITRGLPKRGQDDGFRLEQDGRETFFAQNGKRIAWSDLAGMNLSQANAAIAAALK